MENLDYPYSPTHPGEILKEEIEYRGVSQKELARQMEMSYTMLINMQTRYNMQLVRNDEKLLIRLNET